ncbi:protein-S-isoprenylcysteine carboxyl O-methyltransferase [Aspergillus clavatus NRRL 1]|uniref:Protein-S-isoprenylcysteine O-methyltransferase n=1 Tax=Aspergillus clavatus (strain ATCC 1007 / CBS 513.65 / DSM 816 / NCTC 3887 / NRRL 1 / QM 1276 / 107) TaxID=344612 RepID=A1CSQ4_ASPCL|nr:prenyl cysteine carboxyl methyltransferase Ste14 [Aspergillus clavatus NRRL 1]EAW06341.1 prenyl cysteine carboxyl methyltransferase Ste14 [Aspergillus clavatus NRRL 1]
MSKDASTSSGHQPNPNSITSSPGWRPARPAPPRSRSPPPLDSSNYPTGEKSLSGISLRAFLIGAGLGISLPITLYLLLVAPNPLWRVPFFTAALCLFHFLEYYVTAEYNTRYASISAFLLSSNGWAYNLAHSSALAECLLSHTFGPEGSYLAATASVRGVKWQVVVGILLMVFGQTVRTLAMKQAGTNFNHTVQVERQAGHKLVQDGVYAVLRHPSYFGFFWWGMGTQLVLGNVVCFVGYAAVLWSFFYNRIKREEKFLICFFGDEYVEYRKRTWIGIPGIC